MTFLEDGTAPMLLFIKSSPWELFCPKTRTTFLELWNIPKNKEYPCLARGGGSSQCGQTVGESIVLDYSRHQNKILDFKVEEKQFGLNLG